MINSKLIKISDKLLNENTNILHPNIKIHEYFHYFPKKIDAD